MKIELRVKTIMGKDGVPFLVYKGLTKKGWCDLKFTKDVAENTRPTNPCYIEVLTENVSVDTTKRFPVIWVRKLENVEVIEYTAKINDYFDC